MSGLEELDKRVEKWLGVRAESRRTREEYGRRLRLFLGFHGLSVDDLLGLSESAAEDLINRYLSAKRREGLAGLTLSAYKSAVCSFLKFNDVEVNEDRLKRMDTEPVREDTVPTQGEMGRIFDYADARLKAIMALQAFSLLRFKPIARLKLKHLKDLEVGPEGVRVLKTPMQVHIPSKDSDESFDKVRGSRRETFMIEEGCRYVVEYLNWRVRQGKRLGPESPVIASIRGRPLGTVFIRKLIREHLRKLGVGDRPYVLKKYGENRMLATPGLKESYQRYFSGWKAGRDLVTRYGLSVKLPPEVIDELRAEYAKAEPYLTTRPVGPDVKVEEMSRELQEAQEKIGELEKSLKMREKLVETALGAKEDWLRMKEEIAELREKLKRGNSGDNPGPAQRVVDVEELPNHLSHGWRAVLTLPNGRIVVERA